MRIGGYDIRFLQAGGFRLDGGGLFGAVPKPMWSRSVPSDESNRVRLGCTCLLLDGHGRRVLVETGCGDKLDERDRQNYAIENPGGLLATLAEAGVDPASIDAVLCSHLHFDHVGGLTTFDDSGRPVPALPNARLYVQRREWQDAIENFSHMRTTYRPANFLPLASAGLVESIDGSARIGPNLWVEPAPGHTRGSQAVFVGARTGETLCFIGDIVPTRHHLRPYWTTAYDLEPATANLTRGRLVGRAVEHDWIVVFPHDPQTPAGRVRLDPKGRWTLEAVQP